MTPVHKLLNDFYFVVYPMCDDLPFYLDNVVELMAFTGLPKNKIVFKINNSKSNRIYCDVDNKRYTIYYFLSN